MRFYVFTAIIGYGVGVPVGAVLRVAVGAQRFDVVALFRYIRAPDDILRFSVAAGHVAVVMIICKSGVLGGALAKVGQMALTNYLLTSVLCTLLFYEYGLGMFAELKRFELLYIVGMIWALNLLFSNIWLKHFAFGPLEWVWRSLTYGKAQPMRVAVPAATTSAGTQVGAAAVA
jgi:uncharacterized protein